MSRPIGGIYLKEVRTLLFLKMLILNLQNLSRSILAKEVSLPVIIVVSLDTSGHTVLRSDISSLESGKQSKRQNFSSKPFKPHHAFRQQRHYSQRGSPSCHLCGKYGHTKAECFRMEPHKSKKKQTNEGLVNMMKSVLVRLINLDMAHTPASQVEKVWVKKDETIHPSKGSGLT
jgi:hypothetical protein